ncbi:branched-chain amino acid ABC transporter permease [Desulfolutivibrio sulfoxidireducens]|uniref:branched-chain amino acid ABC transporter permease n=1 Tax=Desulfolutivibrio sulfoxidireducens TaxID=2773299 RepID=UPI00159E5D44|nr:branched-chain amino acid ABC transporter permease [Desulfolutivibrio sulfoxidireducens]QLA16614.1 branched-chain amino acid ABC transporter permease [Desulfolutivibrio sulfoxidireducens]QLA19504.1 branched-chain amino acid ABC transporter permease [Desulfolutivibrio sulfoxidireducens]
MTSPVSHQPRNAAAFFLILCAVGVLLPNFRLLVVNQHLFLAINVLALNFCLGLGGQISLAQGGMAGLGAYASVLAHAHFPQASAIIVPAVALVAFTLAAAVSRPMERLGEGFLAMATLGLSLIFTNLVLTMESVTGGSAGMMVDTRLTLPFIGPLSGDRTFFFLFLGLLALGCWMFAAIKDSRPGRALLAIKDDPLAASSCGIDRPAIRCVSFGLGGAFSAMAGMLHAHYGGFVNPEQFNLELSLKALLFLVIGGPGNLLRPLVAVMVLETLMSGMQFLGEGRTLAHGLLLTAALLAGYWRAARPGRFRSAPASVADGHKPM